MLSRVGSHGEGAFMVSRIHSAKISKFQSVPESGTVFVVICSANSCAYAGQTRIGWRWRIQAHSHSLLQIPGRFMYSRGPVRKNYSVWYHMQGILHAGSSK